MNAITDDVIQLVAKELASANMKYALFASHHEAYAVMLEEVDECKEAMENVVRVLSNMWEDVKVDEDPLHENDELKYWAVSLAYEAIQVAAMCDKWEMSFSKDREVR